RRLAADDQRAAMRLRWRALLEWLAALRTRGFDDFVATAAACVCALLAGRAAGAATATGGSMLAAGCGAAGVEPKVSTPSTASTIAAAAMSEPAMTHMRRSLLEKLGSSTAMGAIVPRAAPCSCQVFMSAGSGRFFTGASSRAGGGGGADETTRSFQPSSIESPQGLVEPAVVRIAAQSSNICATHP